MRKLIILLFIISFFICFSGVSFAQAPQTPEETQEQIKKMQEDMKKAVEQNKKMMQDRAKAEKSYLEMLKQTNPQAYEQKIKENKLQDKITKILNDYRQNKISYDSAKLQMYPLIKESLKDKISSLDKDIERAAKKLETLKKARREPSYLINIETDRMLGKLTNPDEFMP